MNPTVVPRYTFFTVFIFSFSLLCSPGTPDVNPLEVYTGIFAQKGSAYKTSDHFTLIYNDLSLRLKTLTDTQQVDYTRLLKLHEPVWINPQRDEAGTSVLRFCTYSDEVDLKKLPDLAAHIPPSSSGELLNELCFNGSYAEVEIENFLQNVTVYALKFKALPVPFVYSSIPVSQILRQQNPLQKRENQPNKTNYSYSLYYQKQLEQLRKHKMLNIIGISGNYLLARPVLDAFSAEGISSVDALNRDDHFSDYIVLEIN